MAAPAPAGTKKHINSTSGRLGITLSTESSGVIVIKVGPANKNSPASKFNAGLHSNRLFGEECHPELHTSTYDGRGRPSYDWRRTHFKFSIFVDRCVLKISAGVATKISAAEVTSATKISTTEVPTTGKVVGCVRIVTDSRVASIRVSAPASVRI